MLDQRAKASSAAISSDAAISGAPVGIAKRALGENRDASSEAIAKHSSGEGKLVHSPEPIATQLAPMQKTVASEASSPVHPSSWFVEQPSSATAARAAEAQSAPMELSRRAPEPVTSVSAKKIEERIADWIVAVGTALRGPWRDAVWDFYERMTDLSWWWRAVIKPVLKFLARFIPGREPEPSRLSKAIRESFRFLHEPPTPWPPQWQPKKPQDPPKPT